MSGMRKVNSFDNVPMIRYLFSLLSQHSQYFKGPQEAHEICSS